uniref:(California timema) hypothetical protein n=1 Tax=Timema californicum TaxID=61474 RepID=A0A7R9JKN6_TIMCA|nr:unnamed protein product [Timema californicum]
MEAASWSDLIPTPLDGMWTDKLRELCRYYLSEFGATRLYDSWWNAENYPRLDMIANLCRGEGVFRDCLNIVDKILLYKPSGKRGELPFGVVYRSTLERMFLGRPLLLPIFMVWAGTTPTTRVHPGSPHLIFYSQNLPGKHPTHHGPSRTPTTPVHTTETTPPQLSSNQHREITPTQL